MTQHTDHARRQRVISIAVDDREYVQWGNHILEAAAAKMRDEIVTRLRADLEPYIIETMKPENLARIVSVALDHTMRGIVSEILNRKIDQVP